MKPIICVQCEGEIEGKPVTYRGRAFCSEECCEDYDAFAAKGGPAEDDLDDDFDDDLDDDLDEDLDDDDLDDDDLGYKDDDDDFDFDGDDDFDIRPDDY